MTRTLLVIAAGALFGLLVHIITLLAVPYVAARDAYSLIGAAGGDGRFVAVSAEDGLSYLDPGFVHAACRFDLSDGAIRIRMPELASYFAVSFHDRVARPFFVLNDRSAFGGAVEALLYDPALEPGRGGPLPPGMARVEAPDRFGFVIIRGSVPNPSERSRVLESISEATCERDAPGLDMPDDGEPEAGPENGDGADDGSGDGSGAP